VLHLCSHCEPGNATVLALLKAGDGMESFTSTIRRSAAATRQGCTPPPLPAAPLWPCPHIPLTTL
jgi:hypothetical protein